MNYHCAKFGDFSFNCFGFIMRTDRKTERITESRTDAAKRLTHAHCRRRE